MLLSTPALPFISRTPLRTRVLLAWSAPTVASSSTRRPLRAVEVLPRPLCATSPTTTSCRPEAGSRKRCYCAQSSSRDVSLHPAENGVQLEVALTEMGFVVTPTGFLQRPYLFNTNDGIPSVFSINEHGVSCNAGYIGLHATIWLLKDSFIVNIVDNLLRGNMGAIKVLQNLFLESRWLQFIYADDLGNLKAVNRIFARNAFDVVMHFVVVTYVDESTLEPLSTCAIYEEPEKMLITEETLQFSINLYAMLLLQRKENTNDMYVTPFKGETLTWKWYE
ncbi:hypothetical protein GUJ93_ZPchr0004g40424 [Zizania palustris]|uniref:NAD(P)-binding domain-containing protein n=1 Tax=Zizania palustris TaxID=103762 RepID=A0A8J5V9A7_ZIZPA|nr:hypothetical protein GUJ93_ZPchr0004g40424 [Zizania palustris]